MRARSGLDELLHPDQAHRLRALRGARVALLVNPTSVTASLEHAIEALRAAGLNIVRLFGPEHGVRAEAQDMEAVTVGHDPISGLPAISLYGHTFDSLRPQPEHLEGLDVVLCDIQDVGARYYTYTYTIGLMMQACGRAGVACWVLDRPNPLGGQVIEGNVVTPACRSFVGLQPLATRHAMTMAELALFYQRFGGWGCELEIVKLAGWRRGQWFDETGLPWIMPSPNMPTLDTATIYPGQCLLEGTTWSEGRGTTRPFELFGAPGVDAVALKRAMDDYKLPGVAWREVSFKPMFQKHGGALCQGLQWHITDRDAMRSVLTSVALIAAALKVCPERFGWREQAYEFVDEVPAIDLLLGDLETRQALESGADPRDVVAQMAHTRAEFEARRAECLLYPA